MNIPNISDEPPVDGRSQVHPWRILLCFTFTDGDSAACLPRKHFRKLLPHQRVSF